MLLSLQAGDLNAPPFRGGPDAPRWAAPFVAAAIAPNLLCGLLTAVPFNNADASLPRAPPRIEQTWCQSLALTTLTQTPTVVPPSQQQAPRAAPRLEQTWTQNLLESTLGTPPPMPFANFDWPLPRVASQFRASAPYGGPQPIVSTVLPFANYDWPLPVAPQRLEQTWTFEYVVSTAMPFANYDWPLPRTASLFRPSGVYGGPQPPAVTPPPPVVVPPPAGGGLLPGRPPGPPEKLGKGMGPYKRPGQVFGEPDPISPRLSSRAADDPTVQKQRREVQERETAAALRTAETAALLLVGLEEVTSAPETPVRGPLEVHITPSTKH